MTFKLVLCCLLGVLSVFVKQAIAIQCYECNSHNDSRCAMEKLPDSMKRDCSDHDHGTKYTMCRKIKQVIEFEVNGMPPDSRIIRGCGWDESNYKGRCYQRSGFGGRQEVCSCLDDNCNSAPGNLASWPLALAVALVSIFYYAKFC